MKSTSYKQGVTVVVPTLNRGGFLLNCLKDLIAQTHNPIEILVVDQSKTQDYSLEQFLKCHDKMINYHHVDFKGLPQARNYGWKNAKYEAIVYVDDDTRCCPTLISEHLRALLLPGVGIVAGGIIDKSKSSNRFRRPGVFKFWTATPDSGFCANGEGDCDHARGANFSAWRRALFVAKGFDEKMNIGPALYEETDFCLRVKQAGFRIYFNGWGKIEHLLAIEGGCRIENINLYMASLCHNKLFLISRYLRWFMIPVALARLLLLCISYSLKYKKFNILFNCINGAIRALRI